MNETDVSTPTKTQEQSNSSGRRGWLTACGAMAALVLVGCDLVPPSYHGIDLEGAQFGRDFSLQNPDGKTYTLADFKGSYIMLFFGFTNCPDVCPTELARATEVRQLLGSDAKKFKVVLVTVDPERDTAEVLRSYINAFDPEFIALRGDLQTTKAVADEFKIHYAKSPSGVTYTMDHTALTYVLDPKGRLRLALRPDLTPREIEQDLRTLMRNAY